MNSNLTSHDNEPRCMQDSDREKIVKETVLSDDLKGQKNS